CCPRTFLDRRHRACRRDGPPPPAGGRIARFRRGQVHHRGAVRMNASLQLRHEPHRFVEIATAGGQPLWRYVYLSGAPANEAPRPYAHPIWSPAGDVLTNFRPNDHPWHHGLSLTITSVDGVNFWGGPTHQAADGYQWRHDHGTQVHRAWPSLAPERLEESLDWCEPKSGR